ncbi:hypothetical protein [Cellulomonas oligotrophica]|uniref:Uncharacterized protein n=1 Tax=Cellulomonas oligotrophica TaxID=931536 RepID=A0A7Y9FIF9_9CELL|nr:hypothetical protein [Cellulomonas oligotrophica]NYD87793.1 hypothetical protein [Cellulomonas oligotrophica]GIG33002.1 hypothetical protein Col01nite_21610 [Cellulomonas oligotrophica]
MSAPATRARDLVADAIRDALARRAVIRSAFEDYLEARLAAAEADCRSAGLLNARGRAAGIDPRSLFYGPAVRVAAYASPELRDWFAQNGRLTYAEFETAHREDL